MTPRDKLARAVAKAGKRKLPSIASTAGLPYAALWRAINGLDTITLRTLSRVALALGLDTAALMGDDWNHGDGRAEIIRKH